MLRESYAVNLPFQARRDTDKHSQLTGNIEDLIQAFDTLDSSDSIPSIYSEANDLLIYLLIQLQNRS